LVNASPGTKSIRVPIAEYDGVETIPSLVAKLENIETKKQNEGFLPFIQHICQYDSDKIQHMLNNVNLYIKNVVLLNEQLYTTPKLANYQEPKITEYIFNIRIFNIN